MYKFLTFLITLFLCSQLFAKELKPVSLQLTWKYQFQFAGYIMAKEKGFYEDLGLDVDIRDYKLGTVTKDEVLSKRADFGIARSGLILDNLNDNKEFKFLFAMGQASPSIISSIKENGIEKLEDLKGKKMLVYSSGIKQASLISMLKTVGIDVNDIKYVKSKSTTLKGLVNKEGDFIYGYSTITPYHLQKMGYTPVSFNPKDYGYDFYDDILFTTKEYIDNNPNITRAFYKASIKGWEYAFSNIEETIDVIKEKYDTQKLDRDILEYEAKEFKKLAYFGNVPFGNINPIKIEKIANTFRLVGLTTNSSNKFDDYIYKPTISNKVLLSKKEKDYISEKIVFKVGVRENLRPLDFINEQNLHDGLTHDILEYISQNTGIRLVYIHKSADRLQEALKNDEIDFYIGINKNKTFFTIKEERLNNDKINPNIQKKSVEEIKLSFETKNKTLESILYKTASNITQSQVKALHTKWIPKIVEEEFNWFIVWILASIFSVIIIVLLLINLRQKKSEKQRLTKLVEVKTKELKKQVDINDELLSNFKVFTANAVHQIRVPLTVVNIYLDMIEKDIASTTKDEMKSALLTMEHIYDTLAYKVQKDYLEFKPIKLDISELLRKKINTFNTIAKANDKSINKNIEEEIFVNINETEISYLIDNNLSNAIKYGDNNKPIEIELFTKDNKVVLSFKSFGNEIENKKEIFKRYTREVKDKKGHGIGLNMVEEICEKYNININVYYKNGKNIFEYTLKKEN